MANTKAKCNTSGAKKPASKSTTAKKPASKPAQKTKAPAKKAPSKAPAKKQVSKRMYVAGAIVDGTAFYEMKDGGMTNNLTRKDLALYATKLAAENHADELVSKLKKEHRRGEPFVTIVTVKI